MGLMYPYPKQNMHAFLSLMKHQVLLVNRKDPTTKVKPVTCVCTCCYINVVHAQSRPTAVLMFVCVNILKGQRLSIIKSHCSKRVITLYKRL